MVGMALEPIPMRHPTLSVGRRRVPPKFVGLWRKRISFLRFADWLSVVIFVTWEALKSIAPVKPAMLRSPDSFTVVSERK